MSASLVGSEMCIRDRSYIPPEAFTLQCQGRLCSSLRQAARDLRSASVSYTHLTLPTICSV
eukprot:3815565-Alexandrium_andersonii.AAC.1